MSRVKYHTPAYAVLWRGKTYLVQPVHRAEFSPRPWSCSILRDDEVIWITNDYATLQEARLGVLRWLHGQALTETLARCRSCGALDISDTGDVCDSCLVKAWAY